MHTGAAVFSSVILGLLAAFQLGLALGAPWGRFAWGGQHDGRLPTRLRMGSAVSIGLYAVFAAILLDRAGAIQAIPSACGVVVAGGLFRPRCRDERAFA